MKFVFTIHSHVTFLAALATIELEKLEQSNVVIIANNYKIPFISNNKIVVVDSYDQEISKNSFFEKIRNFNYGKGSDKYINRITKGCDYIAFIDLMSSFNRFLVTNPNCKQFNFIEEGIVNYGNYDSFRLLTIDLDKFSWRLNYKNHLNEIIKSIVRILRGRSLKILNLPIQPNVYAFFKNVNFYGFSELAFPNIPSQKKKNISFDSISVPRNLLKELKRDIDLENSFILIGDSMCTHYNISMEHFKMALDKMLSKIKPIEAKKIFVKLKGSESKEEVSVIMSSLKKFNFEINFLEQDIIMELVFLSHNNLTVLGNGSSLLVYSKLMNHHTYSLFYDLPDVYNIPLANDYDSVKNLLKG